jgi:UDP-N-acetylglucosamine 1-carboxyvinyltransferase
MGAVIVENEEGICCEVPTGLHPAKISLPFPSVGATENILLAAAKTEGITRIYNAAREPEIVELCGFLVQMGAKIEGMGTSFLKIEGKKKLHGIVWRLGADRIAFLTYAMMTAGCTGDCFLKLGNTSPPREMSILQKLGCRLSVSDEGVHICQKGQPKAVGWICTGPYPDFPTDGQSLLMAVLTKSNGESIIEEDVFDNRFQMIQKLQRMGANIDFVSNRACITGVTRLHGAHVRADDLRSGAGLLIAGAMAEGETVVSGVPFIKRGYEDVAAAMRQLGLDASWVENET